MFYFRECSTIAFQDTKSETIWETDGDGEILLPANVGVYLTWGTYKEAAVGS